MSIDDLIAAAGRDAGEHTRWRVHYILTEESAIPKERFHDPEQAFGREWKSTVCLSCHTKSGISDYCYPYAKQDDGSWMMTGRVVADWSKVQPLSIEEVK